MRSVIRVSLSCLLLAVSFMACQKKAEDERVVRVGRTVIMKNELDAFMKMQRIYPSPVSMAFPGSRPAGTFMVETEVLYSSARWGRGGLLRTPSWAWKKRYFPAQLYMQDILVQNGGFSEKEVEKWYKANIDSFTVIRQFAVPRDTTKPGNTAQRADSTKDSTVVRPLVEVREVIREKLFCETYPPDSAFFAEVTDSGEAVDTALVVKRWYHKWKKDFPGFFLKKEYEKQIGKPMSDSISDWYGEGKFITPADVNVIKNWLSEDRRKNYENEAGTKYLAEWLLKWKIFSEAAAKSGFSKQKDVLEVLRWAAKVEIVFDYIEKKLVPAAQSGVTIDTAMCVYAFWDKSGTPGVVPTTEEMSKVLKENFDLKVGFEVDKVILKKRQRAGVKFFQSDWKDNKDSDPVKLMAEADSLLAADDQRKAETKYGEIVKNFPTSPEGLKAIVEQAKIQTEKGRYNEAVNSYRKYSLISGDRSTMCNTFFMLGFIYDEYLNKDANAEVHYKWILKNTPDCELADDAEFMCLHLGEPMTSVEELQAEAKRQGRNIEESESTEIVDTAAVQ